MSVQSLTAPGRVQLLQDVFTSCGAERCDKMHLLAESFAACPLLVAFLLKEENEMGAMSPIKYTWMSSAAFRSMPDSQRVDVLKKFASGSVVNTQHARNIIKAVPLVSQAIEHLEMVCFLIINISSLVVTD